MALNVTLPPLKARPLRKFSPIQMVYQLHQIFRDAYTSQTSRLYKLNVSPSKDYRKRFDHMGFIPYPGLVINLRSNSIHSLK